MSLRVQKKMDTPYPPFCDCGGQQTLNYYPRKHKFVVLSNTLPLHYMHAPQKGNTIVVLGLYVQSCACRKYFPDFYHFKGTLGFGPTIYPCGPDQFVKTTELKIE